jgi:hypothetical protein
MMRMEINRKDMCHIGKGRGIRCHDRTLWNAVFREDPHRLSRFRSSP